MERDTVIEKRQVRKAQKRANAENFNQPTPPESIMSTINWSEKLQPNAKNKYYKRGQVEQLGWPPTMRFVPKLAACDAKRATTYQVKHGAGQAEYSKFEGGICKDALLHILKIRQVSKKLSHYQTFDRRRQSKLQQTRSSPSWILCILRTAQRLQPPPYLSSI